MLAARPAAALAYDTRKIAGSVTDVLAAFAAIDVEAKRALVGFSVPLRDLEQAARTSKRFSMLTSMV